MLLGSGAMLARSDNNSARANATTLHPTVASRGGGGDGLDNGGVGRGGRGGVPPHSLLMLTASSSEGFDDIIQQVPPWVGCYYIPLSIHLSTRCIDALLSTHLI